MAKTKKAEGVAFPVPVPPQADPPATAKPAETVSFIFSRMWSSDRGYFAAESRAELPRAIAESLAREQMGEISS